MTIQIPPANEEEIPDESRFLVKREGFWARMRSEGLDGYGMIGIAAEHGWVAIGAWGSGSGWPLGEWPYTILFWRIRNEGEDDAQFELAEFVEGDVETYRFPSRELLVAATDQRAFAWWKGRGEPWVRDYDTFDDVPQKLRGPYLGWTR